MGVYDRHQEVSTNKPFVANVKQLRDVDVATKWGISLLWPMDDVLAS